MQDPDGEYLKFVIQDPNVLARFISRGLFFFGPIDCSACNGFILDGVSFPCPVPAHPERLNDIGMLRMQVVKTFFFSFFSLIVVSPQVTLKMYARKDSSFEDTLRGTQGFPVDEYSVWVRTKVWMCLV